MLIVWLLILGGLATPFPYPGVLLIGAGILIFVMRRWSLTREHGLPRRVGAAIQEDEQRAASTRQALRAGPPSPVAPAFRLRPDETQFWTIPSTGVYQYFGVDVSYTTIHNRAFHPVGWLIHLLIHMPINAGRRQRAQAESAERWRKVTSGSLYITNKRLVLDNGNELTSWWYESLARVQVVGGRIQITFDGSPATQFEVRHPEWLSVLVNYHAFGDVPA